MQHRITKPTRLLNKAGELIQKGYATYQILKYNRNEVALTARLKEWDYYLISNADYSTALTVGKSNNLLLISTSVIDLRTKEEHSYTTIRFVTKESFSFPESSEIGDIIYRDKKLSLAITHHIGLRNLSLVVKGIQGNTVELSLTLFDEPRDSMVIATPFRESDKYFYYNQKIIGMRAHGHMKYKNLIYQFHPQSSFGILDWGRGVWPYKTTWYWSAAQGEIDGDVFGFNLGYGFGDTSAATENMLFFNGIASKLEEVTFHIQVNSCGGYDYMKPWLITSSDGRLELQFTPIYDRNLYLSAVVLSTNQHQVFGTFSGWAVLDHGTTVMIKNLAGFAERVVNRW